jgi:hypothetical protein
MKDVNSKNCLENSVRGQAAIRLTSTKLNMFRDDDETSALVEV